MFYGILLKKKLKKQKLASSGNTLVSNNSNEDLLFDCELGIKMIAKTSWSHKMVLDHNRQALQNIFFFFFILK